MELVNALHSKTIESKNFPSLNMDLTMQRHKIRYPLIDSIFFLFRMLIWDHLTEIVNIHYPIMH